MSCDVTIEPDSRQLHAAGRSSSLSENFERGSLENHERSIETCGIGKEAVLNAIEPTWSCEMIASGLHTVPPLRKPPKVSVPSHTVNKPPKIRLYCCTWRYIYWSTVALHYLIASRNCCFRARFANLSFRVFEQFSEFDDNDNASG